MLVKKVVLVYQYQIVLYVDQGVSWRSVAVWHGFNRYAIGRNLMICAGQGREGDPTPAPGHGTMNMPKEHVTHAVITNGSGKPVCLIQLNAIERRYLNIKRWMMHEYIHRGVPGFDKLRCQPLLPAFAVDAGGTTFIQRVEKKHHTAGRIQTELQKARWISGLFGKNLEKGRAPVVISQHQSIGDHQLLEKFLQHCICLALAAIGQVAGKYTEAHILAALVYIRDAVLQSSGGIESIQFTTSRYNMKIGGMNEFHRVRVPRGLAVIRLGSCCCRVCHFLLTSQCRFLLCA